MQFFSLNKGEDWFAVLTNIAILKTQLQNYWREMSRDRYLHLVEIWKISYCIFSVSYSLLYNNTVIPIMTQERTTATD